MNLLKDIKREIFITILTIIGLTITFFGVTYAIYFTIDEKNIGQISVTTLGFDICIDENCTGYGTTYGTTIAGQIYPMNDTEGIAQTPYRFKMNTDSSNGVYTKIYAAINEEIDYSHVKYAVRIGGGSLTYGTFTSSMVTLINDYYLQSSAGNVVMELYIWLDESVSNEIIGQTISVFVNALGYYKPEDSNNLHTNDTLFANVDSSLVEGMTFNYKADYQTYAVPITGYYYIESYGPNSSNINGDVASGYIYLTKDEILYIYTGNTGTTTSTDIRYFESTPSSSDLNQSSTVGQMARIMVASYGGGSDSFMSGYAGTNAVDSSGNNTNNTIHFSGKYFVSGNINDDVNSGSGKVFIRYAGPIERVNSKLNNVRYIKDCASGSTINTTNAWVEIQAIKNGINIAYQKTVTATASVNTSSGAGTINAIVDGIVDSNQYARIDTGTQCVTIDLGETYDLDEIAVWHYYSDGRTYNNNITSVSSDNSTWTTVINKQEPETVKGKRTSAY